ncbi:hypothetical protein [Rubellimicrobium aerolatum]|uniref:DUF1311 domain-containing protein n=1 Tax=Rubellimicrobium aerolatum TaxID=490979 RepID=A0ABW0SE23_9RHOB|nr:hypothetical protein [Rubellimicrobium aerolatum]MBP1806990.1 hypothetical protein [Rubellimicrobium aerolatum]
MTTTTTRIGLALAVALAGFGEAGWAQEAPEEPATSEAAEPSEVPDLTVPDLSADAPRTYRTCPDRPPRPDWLESLSVRDSYKGVLLMSIYEARAYESIVASGDCSCSNKAPSWDAAMTEYQGDYAELDYEAQSEATSEFVDLKNSLRQQTRAICQKQGNW